MLRLGAPSVYHEMFAPDQISNHSGSRSSGEVTETLKSPAREKRIESQFPWLSPIGHTYSVLGGELGASVNTSFSLILKVTLR